MKKTNENTTPIRKPSTPISEASKHITDTILALMEEQEISPRSLCLDLGFDEGQFSKFAKKKANFSIERLHVILDYLGYEFVIKKIED